MKAIVFSFAIPSGPNYDSRLKLTLKSISEQGVPVRIGFCDVSNQQACKDALLPYSELIKYTRHGPDEGQSSAINEGWKNVDGDVYAWLNVDDYLAPGALKEVAKVFVDNPDVDVVFGQSYIVRDNGIIGLHNEVRSMTDVIKSSNIISQPSCFVRRKALFDEGLLVDNLHYTMDWDLWIRLFNSGAKFHYLPRVLSVVSWDEGTKTANLNIDRYREIMRISRRSSGLFSSVRTVLSFLLEHLSQYGFSKPIFRAIINTIKMKNDEPVQKWNITPEKQTPLTSMDSVLTLPIFHYEDNPIKALHIEFGTSVKRTYSLDGNVSVVSSEKIVEIPAVIVASETYILTIEETKDSPSQKKSNYFKSLKQIKLIE